MLIRGDGKGDGDRMESEVVVVVVVILITMVMKASDNLSHSVANVTHSPKIKARVQRGR